MSKGSNPRPLSVPRDQFDARFDAIFKPKPHDWPAAMGCDCEPGKCKQERIKDCKDWMRRSAK